MKTKTLFGLVAVGLGTTFASTAQAGWAVSVSLGSPVWAPAPVVCQPVPPPCPPPVVCAPWAPAVVVTAPMLMAPAYPVCRPVPPPPPGYGWHGYPNHHGYVRYGRR